MLSAVPTTAVAGDILPPRFKCMRSSTINQWYILSLFSSSHAAFSSILMPASRFFTASSISMPIPTVAPSESTLTSFAPVSLYFSFKSFAARSDELYVLDRPLERERYKTDIPFDM